MDIMMATGQCAGESGKKMRMKSPVLRFWFLLALFGIGLVSLRAGDGGKKTGETVRIHYLGHSAFVIGFGRGPRVVIDYGVADAFKEYGYFNRIYPLGSWAPDFALFSHRHPDHFNPSALPLLTRRLDPGQVLTERGLDVTAIPTYERNLESADNFSYRFLFQGLRLLHLGDCQALMKSVNDPQTRGLIARLYPETYDLVFMPVGFTSDISRQAAQFTGLIRARRVIPMHAWKPREMDDFFSLLLDKGSGGEKKYQLLEVNGAEYSLRSGDPSPERVLLIRLEPAGCPEGTE